MRKLALPALLLAGCAYDPAATATADQTIIGGEPTTTAAFPTVVALENGAGDWFCTGTLVDKDWVLTAAHCVEGEQPGTLEVRFDDDDVNDTTGGTAVPVAEVHSHPSFDWEAWDNDIAMLKLATSVTDHTPTRVHRTAVDPGTAVTQVGYGDADENGGGAGLLRKLDTATIDCATTNDPGISAANLLCFDASDGTASCYGDSGGPTFLSVGGALAVVGVTSGGTGEQCAAGWDLHTSVFGELDFVDMFLGGDGDGDGDGGGDGDGDGGGGGGGDPTPDPEPDDGGDDEDDGGGGDGGGCSAGGNASSPLALLGMGLMLVTLRRRRRM
jgi:MYXO-CTERM domain-containing protein